MGEMEKPFTCPQQDCQMSFTNEDHLQVHQRCHETQLTFTSQGNLQPNSSFFKHSGFIIDQTPTPSRFWRHCEEVSLFQDINLNPFDIEFHKASLNRNYRAQLSISENHGIGGGSLETPRILPQVDSDQTISSTSRDESQLAGYSSLHPSSAISTALHSTTASSSIHASSPILTTSVIESSQEMEKKEGRKKLTLNVSTVSSEASQNSSIISTPTPVIMAGPSVSQTLSVSNSATATLNTPNVLTATVPHITLNGVGLGLTDLNTPGLSPALRLSSSPTVDVSLDDSAAKPLESHLSPKADKSPVASPPPTPVPFPPSPLSSSTETSSVPPSPSATVLQLLLRLPNGQSIPVEIPATPVVTSIQTTRPTTVVVTTIAPVPSTYQTTAFTSVITNPTPSLAKMKLKQALASSNTAARPGVTRHSRATTADRIAQMTRSRHLSGTSSNGGDAHEDNSNSSCSSSTSITSNNSKNVVVNSTNDLRRRRNSNPDESPEEKRRKFLERNRVAAVRCREKKKRFVESIVVKSDELGTQNQKLLNEVALLRTEVASLKSLLLRHKDCPVTLAMQGVDDVTDAKFPTEVSVVAPPKGYVITDSGSRPILPQSVTFVPIKSSTSPEPPSCTGVQVAPSPQVSSDSSSKPADVCSLPISSTASNLDDPVVVSSSSRICIPSFELSHFPPIDPAPYISASSALPKVAGAPILPGPILQSFDQYSSSSVEPSSISGKEMVPSPVIIHAPPSSTGKSATYLPAMRGNKLLIQGPKNVFPKESHAIVQTVPAVHQPGSSVIIDNAFCIHSKIVIRQRP